MRSILWIGFLFAPPLLLAVALHYATIETEYQCAGRLSGEFPPQKYYVSIRLKEDRWRNIASASTDGTIELTIPSIHSEHLGRIKRAKDLITIYDTNGMTIKGSLSLQTDTFTIEIMSKKFDGSCQKS